MEHFIAFISLLVIIFGMLATIASIPSSYDNNPSYKAVKICFSIFLMGVVGFIWVIISTQNYKPDPVIIEKPIEELRNAVFYIDENDKPVELTGSYKFVDTQKCVVHIKIYPAGWKYGMHVSGSRKVEIVKKNTEVESN